MSIKTRFILISILILVIGLAIQVYRNSNLEEFFRAHQIEEIKTDEFIYSSAVKPEEFQEFLVVYSDNSPDDISVYNNVLVTYDMAKLNAIFIDIDEAEKIKKQLAGMSSEDVFILASQEHEKVTYVDELTKFKNDGGTIISLVRGYNPKLDQLFGIKENYGFFPLLLEGVKFEENFFPGLSGFDIESKKITHNTLNVSLGGNAKLIASSKDYPVIWEYSNGHGKAVYVNSTFLTDKSNRGVLLQCSLLTNNFSASTVLNSKILNIDDFPAPIKRGEEDVILSQYNMDNLNFYRYIWLSSIMNFAKNSDLKLTALIIGTYSDETGNSPRGINSLEIEDIKYYGRLLSENRGELGIHGYNHQPLALEGDYEYEKYGYKPWNDYDSMLSGLNNLKEIISEIYGDIKIYTYVPPSNIISELGREAILEVFPDIKVFAGLYTGDPELGVLYQEFGQDVVHQGIYNIPRISSGYIASDEVMWDIYNGIAHFAFFNHFIHPDDILDPNRSQNLKWRELEENLKTLLDSVNETAPYLRAMTDYEAYGEYIKYEKLQVYSHKVGDRIILDYVNFSDSASHFLRIGDNQSISYVSGGEYMVLDYDAGLYYIRADEKRIEVIIK